MGKKNHKLSNKRMNKKKSQNSSQSSEDERKCALLKPYCMFLILYDMIDKVKDWFGLLKKYTIGHSAPKGSSSFDLFDKDDSLELLTSLYKSTLCYNIEKTRTLIRTSYDEKNKILTYFAIQFPICMINVSNCLHLFKFGRKIHRMDEFKQEWVGYVFETWQYIIPQYHHLPEINSEHEKIEYGMHIVDNSTTVFVPQLGTEITPEDAMNIVDNPTNFPNPQTESEITPEDAMNIVDNPTNFPNPQTESEITPEDAMNIVDNPTNFPNPQTESGTLTITNDIETPFDIFTDNYDELTQINPNHSESSPLGDPFYESLTFGNE